MSTVVTSSPRELYGKTLVELGREDSRIVVLGGDLNKSTFTTLFAKEFPQRFFDFGPAEQNIMSVAAGLASCDKVVFASTFAVFGTGRPYDQIRVGIAQPGLNVKIVCTHAGIVTGEDGMSAQSIEDLALMCALPTFTVVAPADGPETVQAVRAAAAQRGPFYIRLPRSAVPVLHQGHFTFQLGKAEVMHEGADVTVVACGVMVAGALEAAERLDKDGVRCRVLNMATLKPVDQGAIVAAARETGAIVTAEEHYVHGGLGSIVAQVAAEKHPVPVEMVALTRYAESGKPEELLQKYGLTASDIERAARRALARKRNIDPSDTASKV